MKHSAPFKHILHHFVRKPLAGCVVAAALLAGSAFASTTPADNEVGAVSLVLGKAYLESPSGARTLIKVGTVIKVSDRIETGRNGHVHIRFVDQALVSVRPSSQLDILRYDYNAAAPENSVVKLSLVEGVARAISGKAAKAARENFRMDTPIAAIGVRGTDFVVSSNQSGVLAQVNEGAIVIAPYSSECSAAAFGPCSVNALELAGGANQIVQISAHTSEPLLLALATPVVPEVVVDAAPAVTVAAASDAKAKDEGLYTDSVSSKVVTRAFAAALGGPPLPPPVSPPPVVKPPEFTPPAPVETTTLASNQLMWGRYSETTSDLERITGFAFDKSNKSGRSPTVGNNVYNLYRMGSSNQDVQKGLGLLGFNLTQAQALYIGNDQVSLMNVTGGMLSIDFDTSQVVTSLQMNHSLTGNVVFSESAIVNSGGIFHSSNSAGIPVMAGAVSLDGKEAGYFFEKTLPSGVIEGLTLWGVQP